MNRKKTYRAFCDNQPEMPLMMQPWYLDAVCRKDGWEVVLVEKGGRIVASLPYFLKRKAGFRYIAMPPLTKMMGPWLDPKWRSVKHEHSIYTELIAQLPKVDGFKQNFHHSFTNWLPFHWKGYRQTTRYTYLLDLRKIGDGIAGFHRSIRTSLKKAVKNLQVQTDCSPEVFYKIHRLSFVRQKEQVPFTMEQFQHYDEALARRDARRMFTAVDDQGNIHAVFYLIWDQSSAYAHLLGSDPAYGNSGASVLLLREGIRFSKEVLGVPFFDFEGSMMENVEVIIRRFGAEQKPYFYIWKYDSNMYRVLDNLFK